MLKWLSNCGSRVHKRDVTRKGSPDDEDFLDDPGCSKAAIELVTSAEVRADANRINFIRMQPFLLSRPLPHGSKAAAQLE
mmetsp:Transcript_22615/g.39723  ORF Transcript_22615/g.39723 Transcript_22615/m.39723 type:complete len:80 (+) Transcript_22615:197-436(+)